VRHALLQKLREGHPQVRLAAAQVITKWEDPALAEVFLGLLVDQNFEVRVTAIQYFERLRDPRAAEVIVSLLGDPDSDVRQSAAKALGVLGSPDVIPGLVLALIDEELLIRRIAGESLKQIDPHWALTDGAVSVLPQLEGALQHHTPWVRQAASQALAVIQGAFAATMEASPDTAESETKLVVS
jgi:HEAT repeat protein